MAGNGGKHSPKDTILFLVSLQSVKFPTLSRFGWRFLRARTRTQPSDNGRTRIRLTAELTCL
eukprot:scaffold145_cov195-Alexandrium_tamarense.AAC.52